MKKWLVLVHGLLTTTHQILLTLVMKRPLRLPIM